MKATHLPVLIALSMLMLLAAPQTIAAGTISNQQSAGMAPLQQGPLVGTTPTGDAGPICPADVPSDSTRCLAHLSKVSAAGSPTGLSPDTIKAVYGLSRSSMVGAGQTIAIVGAYDDPTAESDLTIFSNQYGLPECSSGNGCFSKVDQTGGSNYPSPNELWALEISMDIQWAHAIAPGAKILLIEANSARRRDLIVAVDYARQHARYVSLSFSAREFSGETAFDSHFSQPGVSFFAPAGDRGLPAEWPSAAPNVISVGGTSLHFDGKGTFKDETGWRRGGGGCSAYELANSAQLGFSEYGQVNCNGQRATPDVSFDADPGSGVSVYDGYGYNGESGWFKEGSTSLGSVVWASLAAGTGQVVDASSIYGDQLSFRDIASGNNGAPCLKGFDLCSGRGSWGAGPVWQRRLGGGRNNYLYFLAPTSEGGMIVSGYTEMVGRRRDGWVLKLEANGKGVWRNTYGGALYDEVVSMVPTSDGGYIAVGYSSSFGDGNVDGWLLKLDANGDQVWQKTFGGPYDDQFYSVTSTSDGGYIIVGYTQIAGLGYDGWVLKFDANGNQVWQKTFGGRTTDVLDSVVPTNDGGYVVAGYTLSFGAGSADFWVLKLDANGDQMWQKTFGGSFDDYLYSMAPTSDGGYIVAGDTYSYVTGYDGWIIKLDANGDQMWQKTFGGSFDDHLYSVAPTSDGGYVAAGYTQSFGARGTDGWIIKLDANGDQVWQKTFGGSFDDYLYSVAPTIDGGYTAAGASKSFGRGAYDGWVIKTDQDGNTGPNPQVSDRGSVGGPNSLDEGTVPGLPPFALPGIKLPTLP